MYRLAIAAAAALLLLVSARPAQAQFYYGPGYPAYSMFPGYRSSFYWYGVPGAAYNYRYYPSYYYGGYNSYYPGRYYGGWSRGWGWRRGWRW